MRNFRVWIILSLAAILGAIGLAYFLSRGPAQPSNAGRPVPAPSPDPVVAEPAATVEQRKGDIVLTLAPEKLVNAGLRFEDAKPAGPAAASSGIRITGTIQADSYKEVPVLPIAGGRVREVRAKLGDVVRTGQPLAVIFSNAIAEAQTEYLKMLAELEEHELRYARTVELLKLGAVSREEMEQATARHKTIEAGLAAIRQKLLLLGLTESQIAELRSPDAMIPVVRVEAPSDGTIISRTVNVNEVVVEGKELFRVADLSTVWVIGQMYESDFAAARIGARAAVTTIAYPGKTFIGRVSYIDPRVDPQTRTGQVRIEVPNPNQQLRIGMFVDVQLGDRVVAVPTPGVLVPRAAVQNLGAKQVVYVAGGEPGKFVQRDVVTGGEMDGLVTILSGINAGDRVVTDGNFLLRAESFRLNNAQAPAPKAEEQNPQRREESKHH